MIEKSAMLLIRGDWPNNELLLVKEHGKDHWLFPGGKQEPGETREEALLREIREELSTEVAEFSDLGTVEGRTPEGVDLRIHLFSGTLAGEPVPSSEISTLFWLSRSDLGKVRSSLTPITINKVFPLLDGKRIW